MLTSRAIEFKIGGHDINPHESGNMEVVITK